MPVNAEDIGSIPRAGKFPWRRKQQPTLVFLPAKFHIQRSPAGYSPWGCKESDMTGHARAWPKKKKNLVVRCAVTWVGLEIIILSKVSQTEKSKYCMISCICGN